jgi:UDP-2,3-diacylglucosamine pyrophosphatase LpxH
MHTPPTFDHVSVISDLHMGGEAGFQIFEQGNLLAAFIDHLREKSPSASGLVINGDTVDFLAEPSAVAFDPLGAIAKLDRISGDKHFKPVWDALRRYTKMRRLVVTLGNHDLELALPWVRTHFLGLLTGGESKALSNVTLAFDGSGFACTVGQAKMLCLHGNEVDTWNVTDYERLRRVGSDVVQGRRVDPWIPNAGAQVVIDVMNDVKREHAFVDLLKPEKEAAVRLLLVLKPDQRAKLRAAAEVAGRRVWDGVRRSIGWLSAADDSATAADPLDRIVGTPGTEVDAEKLLDDAEELFREGANPLDLVYGQQHQQLNWWHAMTAFVSRREAHEIAFAAIKEVADATTFHVDKIDRDFELIDDLVGAEYDIVVAGHTHLARRLDRTRGGRYFNSGTWATLMRLTPAQLQSPAAFKPVFDTLRRSRTIAELGKLVWRNPTVVTVAAQGGGVSSSLDRVAGKPGKVALSPLPKRP